MSSFRVRFDPIGDGSDPAPSIGGILGKLTCPEGFPVSLIGPGSGHRRCPMGWLSSIRMSADPAEDAGVTIPDGLPGRTSVRERRRFHERR